MGGEGRKGRGDERKKEEIFYCITNYKIKIEEKKEAPHTNASALTVSFVSALWFVKEPNRRRTSSGGRQSKGNGAS